LELLGFHGQPLVVVCGDGAGGGGGGGGGAWEVVG